MVHYRFIENAYWEFLTLRFIYFFIYLFIFFYLFIYLFIFFFFYFFFFFFFILGSYVDRLVIDPITKNVYFTVVVSEKQSFIAVYTPEGSSEIIVTELNTPRDIIIHPKTRYVI